jgi:hypothetical protein
MGNSRSGRWLGHIKRDAVEDCRSLDIHRWVREKKIEAGTWSRGAWDWLDTKTGEKKSSIGYEVNANDPSCSWVRLFYTITFKRTQETIYVDYNIPLQTTFPHFGGVRWWFTCPLLGKSGPCNRRVAKLYLPPGGRYFGCRHCYNLTYETCLLSHNRDIELLAGDGLTPGMVIKVLTRRGGL